MRGSKWVIGTMYINIVIYRNPLKTHKWGNGANFKTYMKFTKLPPPKKK